MGIINTDTLIITVEMLNLIAEIDEFKGSWAEFKKMTPSRLLSLKKVATIESIGSSTRIEGSQLSDKEIERLLSEVSSESFQTRDQQEVTGYAHVCENICENFNAMPLTENMIKQFHSWLLNPVDKDERHRGEYKNIPIRIEAFKQDGKSLGILFETTSPLETPFKMEELLHWVNGAFKEKKIHPLIIIGLFIVIFLAIHPFQDGNGRLSRLLTTWLMLKNGYAYVPYSSLESIIENNKESYYLALQRTQKAWQNKQDDWNSWLIFFFRCLQRQKMHLEIKLKQNKLLEQNQTPLQQKIIEIISSSGRLTISEIEMLTQANRNTLKKALAELVQDKHLQLNGKGKGAWYSL